MLTKTQIRIREIIVAAKGKVNPNNTIDEDLDYLRVIVKYHIFDLEASKRELKGR